MAKKVVSIRLEPETHASALTVAETSGSSFSQWVEGLIEQAIINATVPSEEPPRSPEPVSAPQAPPQPVEKPVRPQGKAKPSRAPQEPREGRKFPKHRVGRAGAPCTHRNTEKLPYMTRCIDCGQRVR